MNSSYCLWNCKFSTLGLFYDYLLSILIINIVITLYHCYYLLHITMVPLCLMHPELHLGHFYCHCNVNYNRACHLCNVCIFKAIFVYRDGNCVMLPKMCVLNVLLYVLSPKPQKTKQNV